tara:strand:- start:1249 stop:1485 length:237 start_codon:yes stop_codon:yes gene_type:complete
MDREMIWYQTRVLTENGTQYFKPVRSREQAEKMMDNHRNSFQGDYASYEIIKMKQHVSSVDFDDEGTPQPNYHFMVQG